MGKVKEIIEKNKQDGSVTLELNGLGLKDLPEEISEFQL